MLLKKTLYLWGGILLALIIFLPGYTKLQELKERNLDLEEKTKRLAAENTFLQKEIKRIENDSFYQEKIVREKMGVVRKNEVPVRIIPQDE
ncbi:MAG: septum formation initiator family protein [Candidatus Omnitrophota bacterium]|jgi:cell division protein FtsB